MHLSSRVISGIAGLTLFASALPLPVLASTTCEDNGYSPFKDLTGCSPYFVAIDQLQDEGIIKGHPDGTYRPQDAINRAEFTTLITRLLHSQTCPLPVTPAAVFRDVPLNEWYTASVCTAKKYGIVDGKVVEEWDA
jgi:hypothetical protein